MKFSEIINENFNKNQTIKVSSLDEFSADEWDMSDKEYKQLLKHNNKNAKIINVLADDYYDIKFSDGYTIDGISEYHLN
jgi:hypothetical protein